jgi:hypothetical protein
MKPKRGADKLPGSRQSIQKLESGAYMSALVARHVMRWPVLWTHERWDSPTQVKRVHFPEDYRSTGVYPHLEVCDVERRDKPGSPRIQYWTLRRDFESEIESWSPASDIGHAWEVLIRFQRESISWSLLNAETTLPSGERPWIKCVIKGVEKRTGNKIQSSAQALDASLAICHAALNYRRMEYKASETD